MQKELVACKICVDNNRKWRTMKKSALKQHYISMNRSGKKKCKKKLKNAELLLHNDVKTVKPSELVLGRHFYYVGRKDKIIKSEELLHSNENSFCPKCNKMMKQKSFSWSECAHNYCFACATDILQNSLSKSNAIPSCCYPNCNQLLSKKDGYYLSLRSPKYKKMTVANRIDKFDKFHHAFYGYMRQNTVFDVPPEILLIIFDYYHLYFIAKIDCVKCKSVGEISVNCKRCDGIGKTTKNCKKTIEYAVKCRTCNGSEGGCYSCGGTGSCMKVKTCTNCNGRGTVDEICDFCDDKNKVSEICGKCKGEKVLFTLDFKKLCNNQLLCVKCNEYHPSSRIFYWSTCYHAFCVRCIVKHTKNQIKLNKIPICMFLKCDKDLLTNETNILQNCIFSKFNLKHKLDIVRQKIELMILMGYDAQIVRRALELSKGRIQVAIQIIHSYQNRN